MTNKILEFNGEYFFLSNFYPAPIKYNGKVYATSEHAFQATKTLDDDEQNKIMQAITPGKAKRLGRSATKRKDWESIKFNVMLHIVREKFSQHPDLAEKLLDTGDADLVEGNNWNDREWGMVDGVGKNWLGKILMQVRHELQEKTK